jgi:hypothetical protein
MTGITTDKNMAIPYGCSERQRLRRPAFYR